MKVIDSSDNLAYYLMMFEFLLAGYQQCYIKCTIKTDFSWSYKIFMEGTIWLVDACPLIYEEAVKYLKRGDYLL